MGNEILVIFLWLLPLIIGGIIAAVNSDSVNDFTEKIEAWSRRMQSTISEKEGWFYKYLLYPIFGTLVKFSDWTDSFTHRGVKNGTRLAASLYLIVAWLFLLYFLLMVVIIILIAGVILYVIFKLLSSSSGTEDSTSNQNWNRKEERTIQKEENKMNVKYFSIKVINRHGYPCKGVKVCVYGSHLLEAYSQKSYTDSEGWAQFKYEYLVDYSLEVDIEINGKFIEKRSFTYDKTASFTIDWN